MRPRQRDIWLVPIPYSDLSSSKRRPVLVLSNDRYHRAQSDCLVMAITSNVDRRVEYGLLLKSNALEEGLLPRVSQIRADKIYSVHQKILIARFGRLAPTSFQSALALLHDLIA